MKILHINKYHYIKGGAESVFFNTGKLLEEHGHQVIPFCLINPKNLSSPYEKYFVDYPELSESSLKVKLKNLFAFFYNKKSKKKIEELIIKEKPDIAHIHLLFNGISVSILPVLKKHNIPIVMTLHDYRLICPSYTLRNGENNICEKCKGRNYFNCIIYKCSSSKGLIDSTMLAFDMYFRNTFFPVHKYINSFIFVSKFSQQKHQEFLKETTDNPKRLYNFYPLETTNNVEQADIEKKHAGYFLFYGRMSGEKGIECILEAVVKLPSIQFVFIGTGPFSSLLEGHSNIQWLGYKTGNDLFDYVKKAKFTIFPSTCYENNPMTVIESQSLGTPVIGSDIGGIPELIQDRVNGFLFEMGNAKDLEEKILFANSMNMSDYADMSKKSLAFSRNNYNKESHYQGLLNIYNDALARNHKLKMKDTNNA